MTRQSIRTLLGVAQPDDDFLAAELKRLKGELRWLEQSIRHLESAATSVEPVELSRITDALRRIDPVWDLLYPEEQHRVLQLLIEQIRVFQDRIEVRFRSNGVEQIVEELRPADTEKPLTTTHTRRNSSPANPAKPAVWSRRQSECCPTASC